MIKKKDANQHPFLCNGLLNFQKEIDGCGYHQYPQERVKKACLFSSDILYNELGI